MYYICGPDTLLSFFGVTMSRGIWKIVKKWINPWYGLMGYFKFVC